MQQGEVGFRSGHVRSRAEVKIKTKNAEITRLENVLTRVFAGSNNCIYAKLTGATAKEVSQQWIVTTGGQQLIFGKDTRLSDVSVQVPDGFPKVPNGHANASLLNLAKRSPNNSIMAAFVGRITGVWPPAARETEWKTTVNGKEVTKHLTFYDFYLNDGTGQVALSVEGTDWDAKLRALNARTGDTMFVFDMKVTWESDASAPGDGGAQNGAIKVSTVKNREPVLVVLRPEHT